MSSIDQNIIKGISPYKIHIQEQIVEAFKVFDDEEKGKIDIKYIGIIARALGRVPRKAELRRFIKEIKDPDERDFVRLEKLLPALTDILIKDKWKPVSKEVLLEAFQFFDSDKIGSLDPGHIRQLLTEHAEKFDEEEIDKFFAFAVDPAKGTIDYVKCCEKISVPEIVDILEDKKRLIKELKNEASNK